MSDAATPRTDTAEAEYRERLQRAIGRGYALGERIGRGGFGSVFEAWDPTLERHVAIKALRHDLFHTPELLQRFEREAKAVAALRHPNILPIYAVGEGEGIPYMVMPRVEGNSLRAVLDGGGKLPEGEAVRVVADVARALDGAHRHGLVHRDVKPENVMLEGEDRQVLLMDFGVARAATTEASGLTGTGMIVGSPSYMSPEQARGDPDIDHRADIYQLGVLAYELLTGTLPFEASNLHHFIYRQATEEPEPVHVRAPEVSPGVSELVMRCLAKDPGDRPGSARELADALTAVGGGGAGVASGRERGAGVGTAVGLGLLFLLYVTVGISWFEEVARNVRDVSERGEGFYLAATLLMPVRLVADALVVAGVALLAWNVALLYRRHGRLGRAVRLSFARPRRAVILSAGGVLLVLAAVHLVFIMPTLQTMAASAGAPLPLSARVVIGVSDLMQRGGWVVPAGIVAVWLVRRSREEGRA